MFKKLFRMYLELWVCIVPAWLMIAHFADDTFDGIMISALWGAIVGFWVSNSYVKPLVDWLLPDKVAEVPEKELDQS